MPTLQPSRQAAPREDWTSDPTGRRLLLEAQGAWREAEGSRPGGQAWVRLLPDQQWPMLDSDARYSAIWTLIPAIDGWRGAWRAEPHSIPLANGSVSRIDLRFALESVPEPEALLVECARVLREGGWMLAFGLNPYGAARLRWGWHGLRAIRRGAAASILRREGLDILAQRTLGPHWAPQGMDIAPSDQRIGTGRVAWAILATRRSSVLTPLRGSVRRWRSAPGVPVS